MKAIIQRVHNAEVRVAYTDTRRIGNGLLVYACIDAGDEIFDIKKIAKKIVNMRIFDDSEGNFNFSVSDVKGSLLIISNFTLVADTKKGNRPNFFTGVPVEEAKEKYLQFVAECKGYDIPTFTGEFGAHMQVRSEVNGPVNIIIDTK